MKADVILHNGNIRTMDSALRVARWVAIRDGRIAAVGDTEGNRPETDCIIDLNRHTVLPGFIDTHTHGILTGISLMSIDLRDACSIDEVLEKVSLVCKNTPEGEIVTGTNLSAEMLKENRLPTLRELDAASKAHPIQLHHVTMHGCVLNSLAMALAGVDTGMRGVETYEDGSANGIISDDTAYLEACSRISASTSPATVEAYIRSFADAVLSQGVTTAHSLDAQDLPSEPEIWNNIRDTLPVHVVNYVESLEVDWVRRLGYPRVGGCICLDGSRLMKTMALYQPYIGSAGNGVLYYDDETIYRFMSRAHELDMQFAMHAAGDRAIDQYFKAYERVVNEQGRKNLRHRIEHFSMPTERAIELAAHYELVLPMQPAFPQLWDVPGCSIYEGLFGKDRADLVEPFNDIIRKGGLVCGGSDSPVTLVNPLSGIHACVNDPNSHRTLSVTEAINLFTKNGAWAAHEEKEKGTIEAGKLADLVVLDRDPYKVPEKIKDIQVQMTIVAGKMAYMV